MSPQYPKCLSLLAISLLFSLTLSADVVDEEAFIAQLDTIDKYLYRMPAKVLTAFEKCEELKVNIEISDSTMLRYVIAKVHNHYTENQNLEAFKVLKDFQYLSNKEGIPVDLKTNYKYLTSFSYMTMRDYGEAQKSYYNTIEQAKITGDTMAIVTNMFSLGQLMYAQENYSDATKYFSEALEYTKQRKVKPYNLALTHIHLAQSFHNLAQYDLADAHLDSAQLIIIKNDLNFLEADYTLNKGKSHLAQGQIEATEILLKDLIRNHKNDDNGNYFENKIELQAEIKKAKGQYHLAIKAYNEFLKRVQETDVEQRLAILYELQELHHKLGQDKQAFKHLNSYTKLKRETDNKLKKQNLAYLKVKFESEEKEKNNTLLEAKLTTSKMEKMWLYTGLATGSIFLFGLGMAFFQKNRYSQLLESEVKDRTQSLTNSNLELKSTLGELHEFNRILSHDLKEPIRGILSFTKLAKRKIEENSEVSDYLSHAYNSASQLDQLVHDVGLYSDIMHVDSTEMQMVNLDQMIEYELEVLKKAYPTKVINISKVLTDSKIISISAIGLVFRNLMDNAIKFNKNEIVKIKIHQYISGYNYCFEISDNGIGIDPRYHEQIFNKFKRLNNRIDYEGSGLGLSRAKKILQNLQGDISVKASSLEGTTLLFSIPKIEVNLNHIGKKTDFQIISKDK